MGVFLVGCDSPKRTKMGVSHELLSCFAFYSGLVLVKTLAMAFLTTKRRFANAAFSSPEDNGGGEGETSDDVERVRRCHQNDLENVLPFVAIGGLYLTTNPALGTAKLLFRSFAAARYFHTLVYVYAENQPARTMAFFVNAGCNFYMIYCILSSHVGHM